MNDRPSDPAEKARAGNARTGDSVSDPSLDDGTNADWASEGGATERGPATDEDAAVAEDVDPDEPTTEPPD